MENEHIPTIEGLSGTETELIVDSGINFMRAITEAYGPEKGQELWDSITNTLGSDVRGAIFFAIMTGNVGSTVRYTGFSMNKINAIKAVRTATGLGLYEAKVSVEAAEHGFETVKVKNSAARKTLIDELRLLGFTAA